MDTKKKVSFIKRKLKKLYPEVKPRLKFSSKYTLLISVLLSANTTDVSVNAVTPKLFKRANNAEKMAKLSMQEIEDIIRPCGLAPQKSKAIFGLSRILLEKYKGRVPKTIEELTALPGVGHKTASVVLVQGFGIAAFPVDTHIHRLAARWGLSSGKNVKQTEADLKKVFPEEEWGYYHLAIIYFAREHCQARVHNVDECPICSAIQ